RKLGKHCNWTADGPRRGFELLPVVKMCYWSRLLGTARIWIAIAGGIGRSGRRGHHGRRARRRIGSIWRRSAPDDADDLGPIDGPDGSTISRLEDARARLHVSVLIEHVEAGRAQLVSSTVEVPLHRPDTRVAVARGLDQPVVWANRLLGEATHRPHPLV